MTTRQAEQHRFEATGLRLGYEGRAVVDGLDLSIPPGQTTVIVGANASGKSTLLRGMVRLLKSTAGVVEVDGSDVRRLPTKQLASIVGLLPQQPTAPDGITVADLVGRGRYPHHGLLRQWTAKDDEVVDRALRATSTLELADRRVEDLSGGQRQRVWIAMALAQEPDILVLDEPTTFLDVTHQLEVLDLLHELNQVEGTTVVMVLHDLNLAARYADHLVVMAGGAVLAEGPPAEIITADMVLKAFGLQCRVVDDPVCGSPMVVPIGRFHAPKLG